MIFKAGNYYRNNKSTYVIYVDEAEIPVIGKQILAINEYGEINSMTVEESEKPKEGWKEVDFRTWENAVKRAKKAMKKYEIT